VGTCPRLWPVTPGRPPLALRQTYVFHVLSAVPPFPRIKPCRFLPSEYVFSLPLIPRCCVLGPLPSSCLFGTVYPVVFFCSCKLASRGVSWRAILFSIRILFFSLFQSVSETSPRFYMWTFPSRVGRKSAGEFSLSLDVIHQCGSRPYSSSFPSLRVALDTCLTQSPLP